jgi:chromosome segregation protein
MYLKNLTVLGFKSFADKTSLVFQPGITAIVGPNGCGKSNVADSIRWVLGEQSAKALRGGEMADVIFNGTDLRKPLGMAEVSMTVGDIDEEHLRAAGVDLAYNEITVTRRVFRDGASEYYINKTSCRLKDIQQLFMGTGVGRTSYSIMAQGHITQLLSSRPEDRRMVFEEAAGITRFKSQKREALRKLDSTDQNLQRVADLIVEVKRQIGSLQRQAGKARRFRQYQLESQHLDTQLARHQFDVLHAEIIERQALADKLRIEIEVCSEGVLREEDEIKQLRTQLTELEHQINETQQQSLELKAQADQHQSRISFNEERLQELERNNAKALSDITQGEERRAAAEQELQSLNERLAASISGLEQLRAQLQIKVEAVQNIENQLRQRQEALRVAQSEAFSVAQQLTRLRNEMNALDFQKQGNTVRLEKLSAEKIQLEEERQRLDLRYTDFASSVEQEKHNAELRRTSVAEQQQRLRDVQQELNQVTKDLDDLWRQQAGHRSRLSVLEQLQTEHEGFSSGALAALQPSPHVLGALVDRIRVPEAYITAVEAALGHHLQLVLTDQPETAQQILADLVTHRKGRASLAPLNWPTPDQNPAAANPNPSLPPGSPGDNQLPLTLDPPVVSTVQPQVIPEGAIPILSVIQGDETVRLFLAKLLENTLIAPDLNQASTLWQRYPHVFDWVTTSGEILSREGVFTGGSANGSSKTALSFLARKNQLAELGQALEQLQTQINEASRKKGACQSEQTALQASLQEAQTELRTQEVAIATHQGECRALENALRLLHQKVDTVVYEIQSLVEQEQEILQKRQALAFQADEKEARDRDLQQQLADDNLHLDELRQQRDAANNSLTETKVAVATEEQLCQSFRQQQRNHEQRIHELETLVEQRRQEIALLIDRRAGFQSGIQESQLRVESLQHEREQINQQAAGMMAQRETQDTAIAQREDNLREHRRRLTDLQQQRGGLEVEIAQKQMSLQNVRDRVQQKYQLNLDDIRSECITITIADEGPAKVETLTPQEMATRGLATDWEAVAQQVNALQRKLDEMGPVNLVAIEEYEETEQRYQFLTTQHDDLVRAKEQLIEVINRINGQTKEMFVETFAKVRENFGVLFAEIFGGGKADLLLVDENDVLESGIDILARPPGKQLKSISLLSGGEQTMTAVALLFAIYQVKPSPFCVLDELDAPLDESNINRFIGVLKRFLQLSQFIIITHNKRTIGTADVIYGVTMQEQGVSKVVSMKFQKHAGLLSDHPPGLTSLPAPTFAPNPDLANPSHSAVGAPAPLVGSLAGPLPGLPLGNRDQPALGEVPTT